MRHLILAFFLGAYSLSFGQIDTLQSGFGGVVVISGLNQLDSLTWEVTVSSSNWKGAWNPSANAEFSFTEISASDNFFVNCTVFRVNLIDDPVPGVIKVLTIERPAGIGNDPIVGLNAAIFDRTSVQRLPRINRAITEPGEIGLSREDYECLMNDLVARVEANTADAVRRDSTFLINFVSDTSLLSPLQGDRFINASRDTLGMFDSGAWRFFLGLSELPDSIVYAYELDSNLTVLTGYIDSVDMAILTAIGDSLDALTSSLTNPYIPYWDGSSFQNSPAQVNGNGLLFTPTTAPANQEGTFYANDADDRPHYLNGVTDNALAYTSDLITNNTSTNYVPFWDGDSFESSPIYRTGSTAVTIGTTSDAGFKFRVDGGYSNFVDGVKIGSSGGLVGTATDNAMLYFNFAGVATNSSSSAIKVERPGSYYGSLLYKTTSNHQSIGTIGSLINGEIDGAVERHFPLSGTGSTGIAGFGNIARNGYDDYSWSIGVIGASASNADNNTGNVGFAAVSGEYNSVGIYGHSSLSSQGGTNKRAVSIGNDVNLMAGYFHTTARKDSLRVVGEADLTSNSAPFNTHGIKILSEGAFENDIASIETRRLSNVNNYGINVQAVSNYSGGNNYGVYVQADSNDVNWGLYIESGKAYFADTIQAATLPALASPDFFVTADSSGRLHRTENTASANGWESATTDGSGDITVTLPVTMPDTGYSILCQPQATVAQTVTVTARTTTNFTVRFFDSSGSAITSTGVLLHWMVKDY